MLPHDRGIGSSAVEIYNAASSLVRFENKTSFFYFDKCSSLQVVGLEPSVRGVASAWEHLGREIGSDQGIRRVVVFFNKNCCYLQVHQILILTPRSKIVSSYTCSVLRFLDIFLFNLDKSSSQLQCQHCSCKCCDRRSQSYDSKLQRQRCKILQRHE
jgi:hypothetical protein